MKRQRAGRRKRLQKRVLEEWRGLPEPRDTGARTRAVSEVVPNVLQQLGLKERFEEEAMADAWRELVGDFLAQHSRPVSIKRKVLLVRVLQPTLHYDLERTLKPKLLEQIRERFGSDKVRDIRFIVG